MAARVDEHAEPLRVGRPVFVTEVPRVVETGRFAAEFDGRLGRHGEEERLRLRDVVAGLEVEVRRGFGLQLVLRGTLDEGHLAVAAGGAAVRDERRRVRRPEDVGRVGVGLDAVLRQRRLGLRRDLAQHEVVLGDRDPPLAVRGERLPALAGPRCGRDGRRLRQRVERFLGHDPPRTLDGVDDDVLFDPPADLDRVVEAVAVRRPDRVDGGAAHFAGEPWPELRGPVVVGGGALRPRDRRGEQQYEQRNRTHGRTGDRVGGGRG